jgi:cytochrome c-type biogenesis protein CcmH
MSVDCMGMTHRPNGSATKARAPDVCPTLTSNVRPTLTSFPRRREPILLPWHVAITEGFQSVTASKMAGLHQGANVKMDSRLRGNDVSGGGQRLARLARTALVALAFLLTSLPAFAVVDPLPFKDHTEELRFQALTKQLRCLVCQNESLNDSAAPLAADLRRDVFEQMQSGKSDDDIKLWLTSRYSDFVLYDPPLRGGTWFLWFGPLLLFAMGGIVVFATVRRRSKAGTLSTAATVRPDSDIEDDW